MPAGRHSPRKSSRRAPGRAGRTARVFLGAIGSVLEAMAFPNWSGRLGPALYTKPVRGAPFSARGSDRRGCLVPSRPARLPQLVAGRSPGPESELTLESSRPRQIASVLDKRQSATALVVTALIRQHDWQLLQLAAIDALVYTNNAGQSGTPPTLTPIPRNKWPTEG